MCEQGELTVVLLTELQVCHALILWQDSADSELFKDIAKSIVPFTTKSAKRFSKLLAEFYLLINFYLHMANKNKRYSTDRNNQSLQYLGTE